MSKNGSFVGSSLLVDGLYKINLDLVFPQSLSLHMNVNVCTKCSRNNETSLLLWHKRLGHISRD